MSKKPHNKPESKLLDIIRNIAVFLILSAVIAFVGWSLGTFDEDQDTEGWIEQVYHSPGESRRPY